MKNKIKIIKNQIIKIFSIEKIKDIENTPEIEFDVNEKTMDFYEKIYFYEIDSKEKIVNRIQTPLTALIAIFGVQSYFVGSIDKESGGLLYVFWIILALAFALSIASGWLFFIVLSGHTYRFAPPLIELENYRTACSESFSSHKGADEWLEYWVLTSFNRELMKHFIVCSNHNFEMNKDRSHKSWLAHKILLLSAFMTGILTAVFWLGDLKADTVHQIELVQSSKRSSSDTVLNRSIGYGIDFSNFFGERP